MSHLGFKLSPLWHWIIDIKIPYTHRTLSTFGEHQGRQWYLIFFLRIIGNPWILTFCYFLFLKLMFSEVCAGPRLLEYFFEILAFLMGLIDIIVLWMVPANDASTQPPSLLLQSIRNNIVSPVIRGLWRIQYLDVLLLVRPPKLFQFLRFVLVEIDSMNFQAIHALIILV